MLNVLFLYLCWVIYVGNKRTDKIQCYLILRKRSFYSQVWPIMIYDNYDIILVFYHPLVDCGISRCNSRNQMLDLIKDNSVSIYKEHQENISNKCVIIFSNIQQFSHCSLEWSYSQHPMKYSPFTFWVMFYTTKKRFPTFMLAFLFLYLCWVIYAGKKEQPSFSVS